jgi:hypothetical protein
LEGNNKEGEKVSTPKENNLPSKNDALKDDMPDDAVSKATGGPTSANTRFKQEHGEEEERLLEGN